MNCLQTQNFATRQVFIGCQQYQYPREIQNHYLPHWYWGGMKIYDGNPPMSTLLNIGFTTKQSRRALRMYGQDIQRAVEFSIEEREIIAKKEEEDRKQYKNIRWVLNSGGN